MSEFFYVMGGVFIAYGIWMWYKDRNDRNSRR